MSLFTHELELTVASVIHVATVFHHIAQIPTYVSEKVMF